MIVRGGEACGALAAETTGTRNRAGCFVGLTGCFRGCFGMDLGKVECDVALRLFLSVRRGVSVCWSGGVRCAPSFFVRQEDCVLAGAAVCDVALRLFFVRQERSVCLPERPCAALRSAFFLSVRRVGGVGLTGRFRGGYSSSRSVVVVKAGVKFFFFSASSMARSCSGESCCWRRRTRCSLLYKGMRYERP